ncbi:LysR substrate-binding domain-containing protein [Rhodobacteraceae bacterium D3-12]|nr:LysR substrate-binding domain-containing protein [Rhodobacteraceae bacterium D3-12]
MLLLERGHCLQRHALSSFPGIALDEDPSFAATSLPTLIAMVEEGLGITLLPQLALDAGAMRGHQIHLSDLPKACPREIVLASRRSSAQGDLYRALAKVLRRARQALEDTAQL